MSEANAAALRALVALGVTVAPATARWYHAALRTFAAIDLQVAAIAGGGSDVRLGDGRVVAQEPLPSAFTGAVAGLAERAGWRGNFSLAEVTYQLEPEIPPWASRAPEWLRPVTSLAGLNLDRLLSILVNVEASDPRLAELERWAGEIDAHRALAASGKALLTITGKGVDKGSGLRALCADLGINPAEAVVFGDSDVDLPMFEVAGLAVAMGNASAEVQARAGMVTATADEDGVARAIAEIWG